MDRETFKLLGRGDIIIHKGVGDSVVVIANYGDRVTAADTVDVTNPDEWELVVKASYSKEEDGEIAEFPKGEESELASAKADGEIKKFDLEAAKAKEVVETIGAGKIVSEDSLTLLGSGKTVYPKSPEEAKLETFENKWPNQEYLVEFICPEFTALCPKTGQPDFASITIRYIPRKCLVESKSLKLYLFSYRNYGTFHEFAINEIAHRLADLMKPYGILVRGNFYPRGGISINPIVVLLSPDIEVGREREMKSVLERGML